MKLDIAKSGVTITEAMKAEAAKANALLHSGEGAGNDFLGWLNLPAEFDANESERILTLAEKIQKNCQVFLVIGIGGSYLGARAAIEFLTSPLANYTAKTQIFYVWGHSFEFDIHNSWDRFEEFLKMMANKDDISYCTNKEALLV